jgi:maltose/maltodextrin transport system permease protein
MAPARVRRRHRFRTQGGGGRMSGRLRGVVKWIAVAALALAVLYLVWTIYRSGQPLLAAAVLASFSIGFYVYLAPRAYTWRYLFPGLAGMLIFVVFPLLYTVRIGFTNYASRNLLTFERSTRYLLDQTASGEGGHYDFTLHGDGKGDYVFALRPRADESAPAPAGQAAPAPQLYVTAAVSLGKAQTVDVKPLPPGAPEPKDPEPLKVLIQQRMNLAKVKLRLPDGKQVSMTGLREFGPVEPLYRQNPDHTLTNLKTGDVLTPNFKTGFYETKAGEEVVPGFRVDVGLANYIQIATDPDFSGPFIAIFLWTVAFAGLTVLLTTIVGMTLATLLNWDALRFRTVYRTMLFLPYAVPGFISILVFRGLFNQNFGEINFILSHLFGIRPAWFLEPTLARLMILIVNTWLGYPYIMVLCTGLIKSIPYDIYEASALEGSGSLRTFFKITAPLILKPLMPLLVASFAFNFNNFVLISLLTHGSPDFLDTRVPAGSTDILVTYLNRIAFEDSGQQFGLASAISTVIFFLVAILSVVNLRLTKANEQEMRF